MRYASAPLRGSLFLLSLLAVAITTLSAPAVQAYDFLFPLDPKATYLLQDEETSAASPSLIRLSDLDLAPGDIIQLRPAGLVSFCFECDLFSPNLIGVFTKDENRPSVAEDNIIPGGPPIVSMRTAINNLSSDLVGDFGIPSGGLTVVRIPPSAVGLWVTVHDSHYSDNTTPVTPEPDRAAVTLTKGCPAPGVAAAPDAPFVCLAPGLTQELYATAPGFFGGIAFAPDGDVLVNFCDNIYFEDVVFPIPPGATTSPLRRFDAQTTEEVNDSIVHPQVDGSPFASNAGCGLVNDLRGNVYANTPDAASGVVQLDPDTGAVLSILGGGRANGLGIARDPQTGNLVYVGFDSEILYVNPDEESQGVFSTATRDETHVKVVDGIFFEPEGNYLFLAQFPQTLVIMSRDGEIVQNIWVPGQPDGVAFHATTPKFVVTNNTDGTLTRLDFLDDDYTQAPTLTTIASGGFRGDISQVGPDTCLYVPQQGTRYADGTISDVVNVGSDNSVVRICPGFAPPTETSVSTIAGTGTQGFNGDTDPATGHPTALEAQLDFPIGVASDAAGNVYFADQHNHRIRRVDAGTGFISTVAGTGVAGFNGDGIQATGARLNVPNGLALDSLGNLFIADLGNQRVRRVCLNPSGCAAIMGSPATAFGVIRTVAGTGKYGPAVNGGAATAADLFNPAGIAVHAGSLYIADSMNQQIRRVASNGTITAFAGTGFAGFSGDGVSATASTLNAPLGVAVDPSSGDVYIADEGNNRVRRVSGGIITTAAGTGTPGFSGDCGDPTDAQLSSPSGVAVDSSGFVVISDLGNNRIRRLQGTFIATMAVGAALNAPYGVAVDGAGNILLADLLNHQVKKIVSPTSGCVIIF